MAKLMLSACTQFMDRECRKEDCCLSKDKKSKNKKNDLIVIMCPPYSEYKEPLPDQSKCELFDCPHCKDKMWLSEKKKGALMLASCLDKDIFLACYNCVKEKIISDPDNFGSEFHQVNI